MHHQQSRGLIYSSVTLIAVENFVKLSQGRVLVNSWLTRSNKSIDEKIVPD